LLQQRQAQVSWRDLREFALSDDATEGDETIWRQPFPVLIPPFPTKRRRREVIQAVGDTVPSHMPQHLPPYPPSHTYKKSKAMKKKIESDKSAENAMVSSKSIQESLAVLEGSGKKRKHSSIIADSSRTISVATESGLDEAPKIFVNPNSEEMKILTKEQKMLLGVMGAEAPSQFQQLG
jgi:hypothetical protein